MTEAYGAVMRSPFRAAPGGSHERLLRGERVHGVRTVQVPSEEEQADRCVTQVRERLVRRRTQTLNQIHKILRRRNLEWERPTKTFQTVKVRRRLKTLPLAPIDRVVQAQAGIMSYLDIFWMLGMLGLMIWPLALFLPRMPEGAAPAH